MTWTGGREAAKERRRIVQAAACPHNCRGWRRKGACTHAAAATADERKDRTA